MFCFASHRSPLISKQAQSDEDDEKLFQPNVLSKGGLARFGSAQRGSSDSVFSQLAPSSMQRLKRRRTLLRQLVSSRTDTGRATTAVVRGSSSFSLSVFADER